MAEGNPGSELIIYHVIPEPEAQFWKSYIYEVDNVDEKARQDIDKVIKETYLDQLPEGLSCSVRTTIGNVGGRDPGLLKERECGSDRDRPGGRFQT